MLLGFPNPDGWSWPSVGAPVAGAGAVCVGKTSGSGRRPVAGGMAAAPGMLAVVVESMGAGAKGPCASCTVAWAANVLSPREVQSTKPPRKICCTTTLLLNTSA